MITVAGRVVTMDSTEIEVEYQTFNGIVRRIRIVATETRTLQDAHLFGEEVTIEMGEGR